MIIAQLYSQNITFLPQADTILVDGGCCIPSITGSVIAGADLIDTINIVFPEWNTVSYYDSLNQRIYVDELNFIINHSANNYEYELWYFPQYPIIGEPIQVPFDSMFYFKSNIYDLQLKVKQNSLTIDSLSQPIKAIYGLGIGDNNETVKANTFELDYNFPNPFNNTTVINYKIFEASSISLSIYNIEGKLIEVLFKGKKAAGNYQEEWNAQNLSSGIYFVVLQSNHYTQVIKPILSK